MDIEIVGRNGLWKLVSAVLGERRNGFILNFV